MFNSIISVKICFVFLLGMTVIKRDQVGSEGSSLILKVHDLVLGPDQDQSKVDQDQSLDLVPGKVVRVPDPGQDLEKAPDQDRLPGQDQDLTVDRENLNRVQDPGLVEVDRDQDQGRGEVDHDPDPVQGPDQGNLDLDRDQDLAPDRDQGRADQDLDLTVVLVRDQALEKVEPDRDQDLGRVDLDLDRDREKAALGQGQDLEKVDLARDRDLGKADLVQDRDLGKVVPDQDRFQGKADLDQDQVRPKVDLVRDRAHRSNNLPVQKLYIILRQLSLVIKESTVKGIQFTEIKKFVPLQMKISMMS